MAPQVSFYILQEDTPQARAWFACRLAEKAWKNGIPTHIHMTSDAEIKDIDTLLWSFREDSFLPHSVAIGDTVTSEPVTLGFTPEQLAGRDGLLINLGNDIPEEIHSFSRVAEVVVQNIEILELARTRFRQYKDRGITPKHQKVGRPT